MNWRMLDKSPITGDETWIASSDGKTHIKTVHPNQQDLLDYLATLQNDESGRKKERKKGWTLAAKIPPGIILEWRDKYGVDVFDKDPATAKKVQQLLDSRDYCRLKAQGTGFKLEGTHEQV